MTAHVFIFDALDDDELGELKIHAADWMAEAARGYETAGSAASWRLSQEFHDLLGELRRELQTRRARRAAA